MARTRSFTIDGATGKAKIDVISEHSEITSVASDDVLYYQIPLILEILKRQQFQM